MLPLAEAVDSITDANGFAGVVSVKRRGKPEFVKAYGVAYCSHKLPNAVETRFAIASGSKGLTALTVVSLGRARCAAAVHGAGKPVRSARVPAGLLVKDPERATTLRYKECDEDDCGYGR